MVTVTSKPLSDIADVKTGPFGTALHASDYVLSGTPIITVEHLGERSITRQNLPLVSEADKQRLCSYCLQTDDIVFSRVGSVDRNAYVTEKERGWLFSGRLLRIRVTSSEVNPKYLSYYFKFETTTQRIRDIAVGQTMASLNTKILNSFVIEYPPLPEQRHIAEALSDTDALLAAMEKLIAKKRDIKQGAMQELLTGKRRLPGFEGEWDVKKFGEGIIKVCHGKSQHLVEKSNGKYPILATGGLLGRTNSYLYDKPSVLIGRKGTIDKPQYIDIPFWTIDTLFYTVVGEKHCAKYIYYLFCTINWNDYNEASGVPSLSAKVIEGIEITIPNKIEQTVIAETISDMDAEIDALTAKLNKLRHIKQGMMSELLTGRIRLTDQEQVS